MAKLGDPTKLAEQDEYFHLERNRITAEGEAKVARLRAGA